MKRIAALGLAALAGTATVLAASAALSPAGPAVTLTRTSGFVVDAAVTPITVSCTDVSNPWVSLNAQKTANTAYHYDVYVNGVLKHTGTASANSVGVFTGRTQVANLHSSTVLMKLNSVNAVSGSVSPTCGTTSTSTPVLIANRGATTSYALHKNSNGTVTRWNPCDGMIHVRVNPTGGGAGAVTDVVTALKGLNQTTGLHFVYDGTTTFIPRSTNASSQPTAVVVAWATHAQTDYYGSGAIGEGGWRSSGTSTDGVHWIWKVTQGFVVLDPTAKVAPGYVRGISRGALLLHELAHVTGIGHTSDSLQVMSPVLSSGSYASFGSGDRTGLAAVGASHGCTLAK